MRTGIVIVLLAMAPATVNAQKIVEASGCEGRELGKDDVLLIDLSEAVDFQAELARAVEKFSLKIVKHRLIETEMAASMRGAFRKAARAAGKDKCDAVVVIRKGVGRHQETAVMMGPAGVNAYSLPDADEWVEVYFAEIVETSDVATGPSLGVSLAGTYAALDGVTLLLRDDGTCEGREGAISYRGRWVLQGNLVTVTWDNGRSAEFRVEGDALVVRNGFRAVRQ